MSRLKWNYHCLLPLLVLSGCTLLGPDYQRPETSLPEKFAASSVLQDERLAISSQWWQLYQDPQLNALEEKALLNNTSIRLAVARIEEADGYMREVGAALLPQFDLDAGASRSRVTELGPNSKFSGFEPERSNYNIKLGTVFELDFWGKLRRAKESARAQALASRYAKDTVALSLSGLVASNYLLLRSLETQLAVSRDNLRIREESLALTKRRQEGGIASALDIHQAEVTVANLKAQIAELERSREVALHQLAVLTGDLKLDLAQGDIAKLPELPVPPAGLPSQLLESRPDVRQAEQELIAANANIGVAKSALYPTISLTANYGGESAELGDVLKSAARIWTAGLSLNLPIFNAGKLTARVDQASSRQKQALINYEAAVQNAFREVNDALVTLRQNREREAALESSQDSARQALQVAENRYKSGYSGYLEVLDAQRVHNEAALGFIQSRQAALVSTVELFKVLGGGWKPSE